MKASKKLAFMLAVVMVLSILSGCQNKTKQESTQSQSTGSTNESTQNTQTEKKVRSDIIIGVSADVVNPDPHEQNDTSSARVIRMMYDSLLYTNFDGQIEPSLAERYEIISDTEYKFYLRKDVTFHNGYPFTAEDVKYSLEDQQNSPKSKSTVMAISEVIVDNEYEVTIKTAYPYAPLLGNLSDAKASILSKKYCEELEKEGKTLADFPNGTGPMKFKSWAPNNSFIVEKNDEYWGEEPLTTSIEVRVIPETSSLTIALETGEIDIIESVAPIDIARVMESEQLKTVVQPSTGVTFVSFNQLKKPFDDVRVRQALSYAVDKEAIVDVICEGHALVSNSIFPSTMPSYDGDMNLYPYNIEKAKELLTQAGYPNGFDIQMATSGDERNRIAQLMQANYADIGVNLDIVLYEWGAYVDHISGKDHQMFIIGWSTGYEPDNSATPLFHSDSVGATGNRWWYVNEEADALIEKGRSTILWEDREQIYVDLQHKIMEDAVWIPLFTKETVIGMRKGLEGVKISPTDAHIYVYSYVEE